MQIHELNDFTGGINTGSFLALDDGTDTGKMSAAKLLEAVNARIDNIIAGDAPSTAEVIDARTGYNGVVYSSLGEAIRTQISNINSNLLEIRSAATYGQGMINTLGNVATDSAYNYCDYVDISGALRVSFYVSMLGNRGLAFYDKDKVFINSIVGDNCSDYGYTAGSVPQRVDLAVPSNAAYVRFTRRSTYVSSVTDFNVNCLTFAGLVSIVDDFINDNSDTFVRRSGVDEVTVINSEYLDPVYINAFNGTYTNGFVVSGSGFNPSGYTYQANAARYNLAIIPVKPSTKYSLCVKTDSESVIGSVGRAVTATHLLATNEQFDGSVYVSLASNTQNELIQRFETGPSDRYIYVYGLNYTDPNGSQFIQLCEGYIYNFTTDQYNVYYGVPNSKLAVDKGLAKIVINPISSTSFDVNVLDEQTGEYYSHRFIRRVQSHTLTYGGGSSRTVVTSDVWYSSDIIDPDSNVIMQGNTNFIHNLDMTDHTGHVGAGHGCIVQDWSLFFADGEQFDPTTLQNQIECNEFSFITKAKNYLIDSANTQSSSDAIPTLDENGNPIVTSTNCLNGIWRANNDIQIRNRLNILMDGIKFNQCFAGMCCGFYPYFNNILIKNSDYIWTEISESGGAFSFVDKGGSGAVVSDGSTYIADELILFGDNYKVTNRIVSNIDNRQNKNNIRVVMPPNSDNRIKAYLIPCITNESYSSIAQGETVETFNNGDYLDLMVLRKIDVSNN